MTAPFTIQDIGQIELISSLPKGWKGKIIRDGNHYSYQGNLGQIVFQEFRQEFWEMQYTVFRFAKRTVVKWKQKPFFYTQFAMQNDLEYRAEKKKIKIPGGSLNMVWAPGRETEFSFSKNKEYIIFQVLYHPDLVRQLLPDFPSGLLPENKFVALEKIWKQNILSILDTPHSGATNLFFYETRIRDVLFFVVNRPGSGIRHLGVSDLEEIQVHRVDALILKDITEWRSIAALAKEVHISEFRLKIAYKIVMGVGMFERLRMVRLEKGRQLLLETNLQIKAIYSMVGYKSLSGFIDKFKEVYGLPPLQYRKKYQPRG